MSYNMRISILEKTVKKLEIEVAKLADKAKSKIRCKKCGFAHETKPEDMTGY